MKKFFYYTAAAVFLAGCSSSENVKNAETNAIVNQSVAPPKNQSDSVGLNSSNAQNSANANHAALRNFAVSKKNERNWGDKNPAMQSNQPIAENIRETGIVASDNSEIFSSMNAKGQPTETRVFKNHPQLNRVERLDLNNSDVKVYLKNGKILVLPEEKAGNFLTATAAEILEAVGL